MSESVNSMSIMSNIFTNPQTAFDEIKIKYPIILPLLTLIILQAALLIVMYMSIDYKWYVDEMVQRMTTADSNQEDLDAMRQGMEMMSATTTGIIGAVFASLFIAAMYSIMSLYFVIISSITNDGFKFKQWYSFIAWTSMPAVIGLLAGFVMVLTASNGQIVPESINPLSLNELIFNMDATKGGIGSILAGTSITAFWSFALMVIGYAKWTGKSTTVSAAIIFALYAVTYGIWFAIV
jgi:hypothetical protein